MGELVKFTKKRWDRPSATFHFEVVTDHVLAGEETSIEEVKAMAEEMDLEELKEAMVTLPVDDFHFDEKLNILTEEIAKRMVLKEWLAKDLWQTPEIQ